VRCRSAPADPPSFTSVAWQWRPGDTIPLGSGRALLGESVTDVDETPVLIRSGRVRMSV